MDCRHCKSTLPEGAFAWRKVGEKRHTICKPCQAQVQRAWYEANRDRHIANAAVITEASRVRQRKLLIDAKARPCADCRVSYPSYVMQFDHLADKDFTIGRRVGYYSDSRLLAEISKCEVVCANCHFERTHSRRKATPTLA